MTTELFDSTVYLVIGQITMIMIFVWCVKTKRVIINYKKKKKAAAKPVKKVTAADNDAYVS